MHQSKRKEKQRALQKEPWFWGHAYHCTMWLNVTGKLEKLPKSAHLTAMSSDNIRKKGGNVHYLSVPGPDLRGLKSDPKARIMDPSSWIRRKLCIALGPCSEDSARKWVPNTGACRHPTGIAIRADLPYAALGVSTTCLLVVVNSSPACAVSSSALGLKASPLAACRHTHSLHSFNRLVLIRSLCHS
jgi:hypothetical protein